ncbi:NAD(P)-binding domain-containing protein [Egicoccus sp. AB-alg6-2]|uniref:NAD(P)-binding domain-containing protein n=1 Tax=Egicoccus sp. AB-alg6-2 TaxID=3242692 RepID=UPI00359E56EE
MADVDVAVIGAGHAGLAMSHVLTEYDLAHVVLERGRIAERWRSERWDSLRLLTPNWATGLPGWRYTGSEPDGFMDRQEVAAYLEAYADASGAPVRTGIDVQSLEATTAGDRLLVRTDAGDLEARSVVVATGAFQAPRLPAVAGRLPADVHQLHSSRYRNPDELPPGAVLVVGTGASGQQIAHELVAAGRRVFVSVGNHKRVPRRYRGRDYYWWLENTGFYDKTVADVPEAVRRGAASPALTGSRGGGYDLDLRGLAADGAVLLGRVEAVDGARLLLASDLADSLVKGDRAYQEFVDWVEARLELPGVPVDDAVPPVRYPDPPEVAEPRRELHLRGEGIGAVIWATGFRPTFDAWVRLPVLDDRGEPIHRRGVTDHPGLYFVGLHWLHRLRSAFIRGAEEDVRYVGEHLAGRHGVGRNARRA